MPMVETSYNVEADFAVQEAIGAHINAGSVPKLGVMLKFGTEHPLPALSREAHYGLEA